MGHNQSLWRHELGQSQQKEKETAAAQAAKNQTNPRARARGGHSHSINRIQMTFLLRLSVTLLALTVLWRIVLALLHLT